MTIAEFLVGTLAISVSLLVLYTAYAIGIKGKDWRKALR